MPRERPKKGQKDQTKDNESQRQSEALFQTEEFDTLSIMDSFFVVVVAVVVVAISWAAPAAYGGSQARG